MRRLLLIAVLAAAGCGGSETAAPFQPRTYDVEWHETYSHGGKPVLEFTVTRITLERGHWEVRASFTNRSDVTFGIVQPRLRVREPRWRWIGITTHAAPQPPPGSPKILHAETYVPALPAALAPGATWSGTFGGPGTPLTGTYLRVAFGLFRARGRVAKELSLFGWVTDHAVRVGPRGRD